MLLQTEIHATTLIVPVTISHNNYFPWDFIDQRLATQTSEGFPVFLSAAAHDTKERTRLVKSGDALYLRLRGEILDFKAFMQEINMLYERVQASRIILVLAVPTAMKTCHIQHLETRCVRQIGEYFEGIKQMENISSVAGWMQAFGHIYAGIEHFKGEIGAVVSFETMPL